MLDLWDVHGGCVNKRARDNLTGDLLGEFNLCRVGYDGVGY